MKWKASLGIVLTLALSSALTGVLKWRARLAETDFQARLGRNAASLAELTARRARLLEALTNQTVQLKNATRALARARGEVSQLRKDAADLERLRAALEKTKQEGERNRLAQEPPSPPDLRKVLAYWSKEQIAFAGFANQTSSVQSALWAMSQSDTRAIESALAPELIPRLTSDAGPPDPDPTGTSPRALAERRSNLQRLAASVRPATGFYLVSDDIVPRMSDVNTNYHIFKVFFEGEGATRGIGVRKVDNEWRFTGVFSIGGTDEKPTIESNLWP